MRDGSGGQQKMLQRVLMEGQGIPAMLPHLESQNHKPVKFELGQ